MLIAIVVMRSHLYDETRQLLFVYPLLFLTGSVALYVMSRKLAPVAALLSFAIFVWDQVQLHPYQYVYFNEVARFLDIDRLFETEAKEIAETIVKGIASRFGKDDAIRPKIAILVYLGINTGIEFFIPYNRHVGDNDDGRTQSSQV